MFLLIARHLSGSIVRLFVRFCSSWMIVFTRTNHYNYLLIFYKEEQLR